jgi:transcriptional regulator
MHEYNFATLITAVESIPSVTHLPFVVQEENGRVLLTSHMAKANPQWETLRDKTALVVFQGPHAYISPRHYEKQQNVPTWNYVAVHATGKARLYTEEKELMELMEKTISSFESGFMNQFKDLPSGYIKGMLKAIVGFQIEVDSLQGKFKLSQNKTTAEQKNIISELSSSNDSVKEGIAKEMNKKLDK